MGSVGIFAKDDVRGEVGAALLDRADNDGKPRLEVPADKGASGWLEVGFVGWLDAGRVGWLWGGCVGWLEVPSGVESSA